MFIKVISWKNNKITGKVKEKLVPVTLFAYLMHADMCIHTFFITLDSYY